MPSFIATGKSPCKSHPDHYGFECPSIKCDKNLEPCCSCMLPSRYDDTVFSGPKRFADTGNGSVRGFAKGKRFATHAEDMAVEYGFEGGLGHMVVTLRDQGVSYADIARMVNVSRSTVRSAEDEY